ncbi:hypothetical protein [Flammeovirga sp. OC4]|uniref:hypothetical protein n=1 Tax=Flammeovirga sp. OC4 TaxID=1382345 RepID=UPI0012E09E13|nr:hypothetical protein [Flammeovirga sp. OC4]
MTYILGTVKNDTVYIVGDSVITSVTNDQSSFKEIHTPHDASAFGEGTIKNVDDLTVMQESTKKINIVSDKIVTAFAGNANIAYGVIENIVKSPKIDSDPIRTIEHFTKKRKDIQLLFSIKKTGEPVVLYCYNVFNDGQVTICQEGEIVHLGGYPEEIKEELYEDIEKKVHVILDVNCLAPELQRLTNLKLITAYLQSFHYLQTIELGIGGTYFGIVHHDIPTPLDDTAFILVNGSDIRTLTFELIGTLTRGDKTIVNSPFLNKPFRLLEPYLPTSPSYNQLREKRVLEWLQDHDTYEEIVDNINNVEYQDYLFLHQNEKTDIIKILFVPNFDNRIKDIFEITPNSTIKPIAQEFLDKMEILIGDEGELIDML